MARPLRFSKSSRRWSRAFHALRALGAVLVCLCAPLFVPRLATADLSTEPTVKTGEPTVKTGDLDTSPPSTGTVVLTPGTGPKPTGGPKPPTSAPSTSASESASTEPIPSASASASASGKPALGSYERRKVAIGVGDLAISVKVPDDWGALDEDALPIIEPSEDAKVILRKGFGVHKPKGKPPEIRELVVVCATAKGDYWGDNIRDAAFTQMVSGIEKEAQKYTTLQSIEPEPIRVNGDRFEQSFGAEAEFSVDGKTATVAAGSKKKVTAQVKLLGLSFIGFHAEDKGGPTLVACSIACAQMSAGEGDPTACPAVVGSIEITGNFAPPPKRSWIAELLFTLKKDPTTMWLVIIGSVFLLVVVVVVIVVIARRKPKTAAHEDHDEHLDHDEHGEHDEHEGFEAGYQAGLAAARAAAGAPASAPVSPGVSVDPLLASPPPPTGYHDPSTL